MKGIVNYKPKVRTLDLRPKSQKVKAFVEIRGSRVEFYASTAKEAVLGLMLELISRGVGTDDVNWGEYEKDVH